MIVALARKLLIALWRLVTTGEVPEWSCARHHERQLRREGEHKSHPGSPSCGLPMTIRGGGDPALNPMAFKPL
ncbi:MAG TPA: hypothetical protein VFY87_01390, partial [Geminicoccaceae bacterium]|nr:hypothetical protein [Geminicoccaceae bacterium]